MGKRKLYATPRGVSRGGVRASIASRSESATRYEAPTVTSKRTAGPKKRRTSLGCRAASASVSPHEAKFAGLPIDRNEIAASRRTTDATPKTELTITGPTAFGRSGIRKV